jgi:hypothetical protein
MSEEPVALVSVRYSNEPYTFTQLKMLPNGVHKLYRKVNLSTDSDKKVSDCIEKLSDEEILALWVQKNKLNGARDILDFARAILKKASEK